MYIYTWTCAYIPVLVVTVAGWSRNLQQNIFNHPWSGPLSSHIPLDNGINYQPQLLSRIPSIIRMNELRSLPPTFQKRSTAKTTRKLRWQCKSTIWRCIPCKNADFPAKLVFRGVLFGVGSPATIFWQEGKTFLLHLEWQLDSQWTCGIVSRGKCIILPIDFAEILAQLSWWSQREHLLGALTVLAVKDGHRRGFIYLYIYIPYLPPCGQRMVRTGRESFRNNC